MKLILSQTRTEYADFKHIYKQCSVRHFFGFVMVKM